MKKAGIQHILFCFLLAAPAWLSGQVQVSARLDSSQVLIGDQVRLELLVTHPADTKVTEIAWPVVQEAGSIEVLNSGRVDSIPAEGGQVILRQELVLTSFDSGYQRIPPIPVHFLRNGVAGVAESSDLGLMVSTFPLSSDTAALAPIKTIIEEPLAFQDLLPYLAGGLALILLCAAAWFIWKRRGAGPETLEEIEKRPPHEVALEDLEKLRQAKLWQGGQTKAYYSELTRILRTFLENRFYIKALESTTGETMAMTRDLDLEGAWRDDLERVLRTADTVKFAKAAPPPATHDMMWDVADRLVRQIPPEEKADDAETAQEKENNFAEK